MKQEHIETIADLRNRAYVIIEGITREDIRDILFNLVARIVQMAKHDPLRWIPQLAHVTTAMETYGADGYNEILGKTIPPAPKYEDGEDDAGERFD